MVNQTPQYQQFGAKTLYLMILKRSSIAFIILLIIVLIFISLKFIPENYIKMALNAILISLIALIPVFLVTVLLGWLEYTHYGIFFDENNFKIKKGCIEEEEIGIPYRFIKEVTIRRYVTDQIIGISNITITILAEEKNIALPKESKIILPLIDKKVASQIQEKLLKRAGIEKFNVTQ